MSLKNLNFSAVCLMMCLLSTVTPLHVCGGHQSAQTQRNALYGHRAYYKYVLGKRLWKCLQGGCAIVSGTVRAVASPEKKGIGYDTTQFYGKAVIDVEEWIWRKPSNLGDTIELDYPLDPSKRNNGAFGGAWPGIALSAGLKLLIVLWDDKAQRLAYYGKLEQTAIVVPELDLFDKFREITNQHQLFEQSPEKFIEACQELIVRDTNDLFLGYFMEYLRQKVEICDREKAISIYAFLLNTPGVSDEIWADDTPYTCVGVFNQLSDKTRDKVIRALIQAAAGENLKRAKFAIDALTWRKVLFPLKSFATPYQLEKIAKNYRELASQSSITEWSEFEEQLGLKPTN